MQGKVMKIAHISDLHIRNFKYRREYAIALGHLRHQLTELRPDLIVNTGDTVHSKLAVSPELFDDVAYHCIDMCEIAPYWVILGNHDLNLKNKGRTDAISPIVRALQGRTRHELRMPEECERMLRGEFPEFAFWNHDIRGHKTFVPNVDDINIGLYHGSISGCQTDMGFVMEDGESEVSRFDAMDYVMMGDIHKRQSFRDGRMQYPGSLIQQNYGEELTKGFILWEIDGKDDFRVDFHPVEAPGRFYTISVPASLDLSDVDVPQESRIRAKVQGDLSPSQRWDLEKRLFERFAPLEVITPDASAERTQLGSVTIDELVGSRDVLMRDHLRESGCPDARAEKVVALFQQYEDGLDDDAFVRGTSWQLRNISWDNMLNYGEGNSIDLTRLSGLVGIFAPNASGKSSIFDILLQSLFDKISKEVPRNIDLVNDNKNVGTMQVEFHSSGRDFKIERKIERIHYGQRTLSETKQWGKTALDFSAGDESLNGTSRPETERSIRRMIGSFEDFVLTTMVSQNPVFGLPGGADLLNCKETDRRKILFRFLDLDMYERINADARDDIKTLMGRLKGLDRDVLAAKIDELTHLSILNEAEIVRDREELARLELEKDENDRKTALLPLLQLVEQRTDLSKRAIEAGLLAVEAREKLDEAVRARDTLVRGREELLLRRPIAPPFSLDSLLSRINDARTLRSDISASIGKMEEKMVRGIKSLKTLDDIPCEGKFPQCRFISEASEFVVQKQMVEKIIASYREADALNDADLTSLEMHEVTHKALSAWEKSLADIELKVSQSETSIERIGGSLAHHEAEWKRLESELEEVCSKVKDLNSEQVRQLREAAVRMGTVIKSLRDRIDGNLRSLGANESQLRSLSSDLTSLDGLQEQIAVREALSEMTGKNGLPYRILTLVLPLINAEIAKILAGVVRFAVFFEDDPENQTVSLYIRYGDYKSRPLGLGSGAEKFIASLAVRVALLSVSSLPKTDMLIIDEGFGKLDPEHLESLQRMFEYLKGAFGTVFIVSHVDFMRDIVDHSVEISSLDGYAHVSVT